MVYVRQSYEIYWKVFFLISASYFQFANEELKEMKRKERNHIFTESNKEQKVVAELENYSDLQLEEDSEKIHTGTVAVMGTSRRKLDCGES